MKYLLTIILTTFTAFTLFANSTKADSSEIVISDDIFEAIHTINIVSLNVLLAEGAEIDEADENGNTPLMLASKVGNPRMVKIILAHQPDVNKRNNDGYTALMIASEQGQIHIVEQLINKGADMSAKNDAGLTASDLALRFGQPQILNLLEGKIEQSITR
jgi:ankyrin repeat protein